MLFFPELRHKCHSACVQHTVLAQLHELLCNDDKFTICFLIKAKYMDTIGVNYYAGWYAYPGYPDAIPYVLSTWLENWNKSFGKPFFVSEYGAGAVSGIHMVSHTHHTYIRT